MMSNTCSSSLVDINDRVYYLNARVSLLYEIFILIVESKHGADFSDTAWRGMLFLARTVMEDAEFLEERTEALLRKEQKERTR